jgi:hypothetical protein
MEQINETNEINRRNQINGTNQINQNRVMQKAKCQVINNPSRTRTTDTKLRDNHLFEI